MTPDKPEGTTTSGDTPFRPVLRKSWVGAFWRRAWRYVGRRRLGITGSSIPLRAIRDDVKVSLAAALGLFVFMASQLLCEGRVNNAGAEWCRQDQIRVLISELQNATTADDSFVICGLRRTLEATPPMDKSGILPTALADTLSARLDGLGRMPRYEKVLDRAAELRTSLRHARVKHRAPGFKLATSSSLVFWFSLGVFCIVYALGLLALLFRFQGADLKTTADGTYFPTGPKAFAIFGYFLVPVFLLLWLVWGRDISSDLYWFWAVVVGAVLAAYAGAKNRPLSVKERLWAMEVLEGDKSESDSRGCISWLSSRIDEDRTVAGWILIAAFALGFTLMFVALQAQKETLTPEGGRVLFEEYALMSAYGWFVGLVGIFFRYLKRVKYMQEFLRRALTRGSVYPDT